MTGTTVGTGAALRMCLLCSVAMALLMLESAVAREHRESPLAAVYVLGSSTAVGYGATPGNAWPQLIEQAWPGSVVNLAEGATTITYAAPTEYIPPSGWSEPDPDRNVTYAIAEGADIIVVNFPSNYVVAGGSTAQYMDVLAAIVSACVDAGVDYRIVTTQPRNFGSSTARATLADTATAIVAGYGPKVADVYNELADADGRIKAEYSAGDGIHVNDAGHMLIFTQLGLGQYPELSLHGDDTCYSQGETIEVTVELTGDSVTEIVGGQFFLTYDDAMLSFVDAAPSTMFPLEVHQCSGETVATVCVEMPGLLEYAVGVNIGDSGTTGNAIMATLTFEVIASDGCTIDNAVAFNSTAVFDTKLTTSTAGEVFPDLVDLHAIVIDATEPQLTLPPDAIVECPDSTAPEDIGYATATDNCDTEPVIEYSDDVIPGGCAHEMTITRTWTATDACGNVATAAQTIEIVDTTAPQLLDVPDDVTVDADAGTCEALVQVPLPTATDFCDDAPVVSFVRDDDEQAGLDEPFPSGETIITWTATDACGNTQQATTAVTVQTSTTMSVTVTLQGADEANLTRCIAFELTGTEGTSDATVQATLTFAAGVAVADVPVPCGTYGTCIAVRDPLHTLRATGTLSFDGAEYAISDLPPLIGGDLNDDGMIDILDFGVLVWQNGSVDDASTACDTAYPHADIDGDAMADMGDFTFIQINFLSLDDACAQVIAGTLHDSRKPATHISTRDLARRGLGHLVTADLNRDGWVDQSDIAVFLTHGGP